MAIKENFKYKINSVKLLIKFYLLNCSQIFIAVSKESNSSFLLYYSEYH